jgi:hypothetical protein
MWQQYALAGIAAPFSGIDSHVWELFEAFNQWVAHYRYLPR